MASVLCSFAKRGQNIREVKQGDDRCFFEARIAQDMRSNEGSLIVQIQKMDRGLLL